MFDKIIFYGKMAIIKGYNLEGVLMVDIDGIEVEAFSDEKPKTVVLEQDVILEDDADELELFDEKDNSNHPDIIPQFKKVWKNKNYQIKALHKNQTNYPFEYNIYDKDTKIEKDTKPKAKITIKDINHVVLISDDLGPFIETMTALKENGAETIELKLNTSVSEQKQKEFAARALIAGALTGIKVEGSPYSLEDLKDIDSMVPKLIELEKKKAEAKKAAEEYVANNSDEKKKELETGIEAAFDSYRKLDDKELTPLDKMNVFKCGIEAVKDENVKAVAQQVQKKIARSSSR